MDACVYARATQTYVSVCVHANNGRVRVYYALAIHLTLSFVPLIPARARMPAPERVLNV